MPGQAISVRQGGFAMVLISVILNQSRATDK
jgi:hypothetical protein